MIPRRGAIPRGCPGPTHAGPTAGSQRQGYHTLERVLSNFAEKSCCYKHL